MLFNISSVIIASKDGLSNSRDTADSVETGEIGRKVATAACGIVLTEIEGCFNSKISRTSTNSSCKRCLKSLGRGESFSINFKLLAAFNTPLFK
ncbi:hypothetical protein WICMUC_004097 [Wickerhamomyces mucosus]|uniref:Uncharacterized protein n=1 Tax=Wickerhamomyces mucosus TaxID=1378264 RepID=A0A9P8TB74_9ASCO|nr:hypothetical protein WICMUC_004097 [Wickerhamomyces mucosus]